jgi:hypothetical protein
MRIIREVQKDTMVYWAYTGADRYGQPTYAAPVQMTCRWDEAIKQVFAEDGSPVFSKIELITQSRLQPKGMVRKGTVASLTSPTVPKSNTGVHEVIMVEETPMLKTRSVTLFEAYA